MMFFNEWKKSIRRFAKIFIAVVVVLFVGCNKSENEPERGADPVFSEKVKVSMTLNGLTQTLEPMSKAETVTLPDTVRLRLTLNVFDEDGNVAYVQEKLLTETGGDIPVEFTIAKGNYDMAFWADYVIYKNNTITGQAYTFTTLQEIVPDGSFDGDAFSLVLRNVDVNDDMTIREGTELSRAVSMLKIESTDVVPENAKKVRYTLSKTATSLNLLTGLVAESDDAVSYEVPLKAGSPVNISRYMLPCEEFGCTIEALDETGGTIVSYVLENVVMESNVKTVLNGNFFADGVSVSLTLNMEKTWDTDRNYTISPNTPPIGSNINDEEIVFPDENFKAYCLDNFDTDGNGIIQYKEIKNVREIRINSDQYATTYFVKSFDGIEYFTSLSSFTYNTYIVDRVRIPVDRLDLSHNTALKEIRIEDVVLPDQNFEKNGVLTSVSMDKVEVESLNFNSGLVSLYLREVTVDRLDLSDRPSLSEVDIYTCPLQFLDLANSGSLRKLFCTDCNLTVLDLTSNVLLRDLNCSGNQIASLDVSSLPELYSFDCSDNNLTVLDLYANRKLVNSVVCYNNPLTTVYVCDGYSFSIAGPEGVNIVTKPL